MKKVIKLNEKDIEKLVTKIIKEDNIDCPRGGLMFGNMPEIIDGVINRIKEHGDSYIEALNDLNNSYPVTKYKKINTPKEVIHPEGVKVSKTVYPNQ